MGLTTADIRRANLVHLIGQSSSAKAFAARVDMNADYVSQLVTGFRNVGNATARKIEARLNRPIGWMDTPHGVGDSDSPEQEATLGRPISVWSHPDDLPPGGRFFLPTYETWDAQGDDRNMQEAAQTDQSTCFEAAFAAAQGWTPTTHFTITVHGDAMIEAGIRPGWLLVVDSQDTAIEPDEVYALKIGDDVLVRYLEALPDEGLRIVAANTAHPIHRHPRDLTHEQRRNVTVLGRVVHAQGKIGRAS